VTADPGFKVTVGTRQNWRFLAFKPPISQKTVKAGIMQFSPRVHRVLEKSLKVLEFGNKNSRLLKVLENRVGP